MLDPQYLVHITDEIEDMFVELESSILSDIARRIKGNKYVNTSTAQYQLNRLSAMGIQYDEMQKQIASLLDITEKNVSTIINKASYESLDKDNIIFKEAFDKGIIHHFNFEKDGMRELILAGIKATNGEIKNICKTTAQTASDLFVSKLDQVYLQVVSGAFSPDEAVKTACTEIGKKGIQWIDYKSGTHRRVDSSIRTAIRTGVNQTACKCQDKNFDDMGGNLVEVTSHMGARPEHAIWQGKIYWRKKQYKNYRNFEVVTGYGTGAGLGGWNCRHSYYPYFDGLSSKSFEPYRIGENNGRYELDQEQRYNERMIREWKRRSSVNKAGGVDNTKEAHKVREWTQRQTAFLDAHPELKRNYARESVVLAKKNGIIDISDIRVSGGNDPSSKKANAHANLYYESVRKMKIDYKKIALNTGFDESEVLRIKNYLFLDEHELLNGKKRFDPDYSIAESWRRLAEGKNIQLHDMTLLKHEVYEKELIKTGLTQDEAHKLSSKKYNYDKEVGEYYARINKHKKK